MGTNRPKSSIITFLTTTFLLFTPLFAGTLTPYGVNNIDASVANRAQSADYTFSFIPDTTIPAGGIVQVTFPSQYDSGLGVSSTPTCSVSCTVSSYAVQWTLTSEITSGTATSVTIYSVMNPTTKGGTGSFQIQTLKGVNVLDENLIFGVIGIADSVGTLTSTIVSVASTGLSNAGETTRYNFQFKVSQLIPASSYMKLTIADENFGLTTFPACNAYAINGLTIQGKFTCETSGRDILVRGLGADIPASQDVGISVAMINPSYSGTSDTFTIALLREGTNVIYDVATGIAGVSITAGQISSISLTQVDTDALQSRSKKMDYILTFQLKNGLTNTSVISLVFPPSFVIDTTASALNYIRYGLEDIAEDNTVGLSVSSSNILTLSNFLAFDVPQEISLYLRLTNPDNVGETTPVNIISYLDTLQTITVDSDTVTAYTIIESIPGPTSHSITGLTATAGQLQSAIEFSIQPSVSIPDAGVIQIRVPDGFTLGTITATTCQMTDSSGTYQNAASCTNSGNTITMVFPNTIGFPLGFTRLFRLQNLITTPSTNGTFLFDLTSFLTDGSTTIESWTDYLIVQPAPFTSYTATTLERFSGRTTILTFTLTTPVTIPAGVNQYKATDTKGFLEFEFTNTATDLGLGYTTTTPIPCYANSGLVPITGSRVNCTLIPGSPALIRVDNFQQIPASTSISISFPGIKNPSVAYTVKMKTIQLANRVRTEFNSVTVTFTPPGTATALADATTTSTSSYAFTSTDVTTTTSVTFDPTISTTLTGPGTFVIQLPLYDIGWIPSSDSITCKLGNTIYSCTRYYGQDWITIRLASATTYSPGTTFTITGLQVPRYSYSSVGGIVLKYIPDSTMMRTVIKNMNAFPAATVPTFSQATLIADKKNKGAVNAQYTLVFVAPNDIPTGSSIIITLPTGYNLLSSSPAVSFSSPDLVPTGTKLSYSTSISSVTISGFSTQSAYTSFSIVISGLKNPSTLSLSQTWIAQVTYNGNLMVYHSDFDKFVFTGALSAGVITFNSIGAFPMNADEDASYTINFVPASAIPVGGKILITFPTNNYESLPSPPSCSISGGVTTFSSCTLSGNTYTIVLDTQYSSGGIIVTIDGILNPDRGTTDGFIVQTYYDGVLLDNTDTTSTDSRTVTIVDEGDTLAIQSISFDPKNEGESANYTFSFVPSNTIESTMEIQIVFPADYDKTLGESIDCEAPSGLLGTISCSVSDRVVTVTGFDTYLPDAASPVTISIFGVVNPNQGSGTTGEFKIGTLTTGTSYYVDYNSEVGTFTVSPAPGWSTLYAVTPDNLYTRLESNYFFNFTATTTIPKTSSDGAILIDYPTQFDIADGETACDTTTSDFAEIITCTFSRNTLSIQGQTQDYTGNVGVILRNILNPTDKGTAKNIVVKTYDGLNSLIIERSFKNLDPFIFTYTYPGPLITVNNDEPIYAYRGTRTNNTYITLEFPCALNLTLKSSNPGFSVVPFAITLSLGQVKASFQLSIPESFPEGTYEIEWETQGDLIPPYYTPIKNTQVIVSTAATMTIQTPTINTIPFGGNSLPASFTVDYGPDIDLEISVNFLVTYPGLTLSTNLVTLAAGQTSASFTISSASNSSTRVSKGSLVLSLAGINQDLYALSSTSLSFSTTDPDLTSPYVTVLTVTNVTKNSAVVTIGTSEICMIYYMLALQGTVLPELSEVQSQGPAPYSTTQSQYGVVQVMSGESEITVTFDNLVAETPYVIYVYLVDAGDNVNTPATQTFTTLNRDNGVTFSMKFDLFDLNQAQKDLIVQGISFTLSLWLNKLQEQKYAIAIDDADSGSRLLATQYPGRMLQQEVYILMNLQLAATPESAVYPSPKELAVSLNNKYTELKARLSDTDTGYEVEAFEFQRYKPAFPASPIIIDVTSDSATFSGKLSNYGWIFISCVELDNDHGVPTPYQILHGFDNRNIAVPSSSVEVSQPYQPFQIVVENLNSMTNYTAYIIGGSAHPGYPDPMDAKDIVQIKFFTQPANYVGPLIIKGESRMTVGFTGLFGFLVAFWVALLMI